MYEPKELDVSVAIVVADKATNKINETLRYNYEHFIKYKKILVTNDLKFNYYNQEEKYDIYGTDSYQILENYDIAMHNCKTEWCFLVQAGSYLNKNIIKTLSKFILSDKDIIFPVKKRVYEFTKNPLNGLLINKNTYNKIGKFGKDNPIDIIKLLWANDAVNYGCLFKAIVGLNI